MENKEQLYNEYLEWLAKYLDAQNRLNDLLPSIPGPSKSFLPSKETVAEYAIVREAVEAALMKIQDILEKIAGS